MTTNDDLGQPNDPLHGITLEMMVNALVAHYGWRELGNMIPIRCFNCDPSVKSSLKFLRKTLWARKKVEDLYLWMVKGAPTGGLPARAQKLRFQCRVS